MYLLISGVENEGLSCFFTRYFQRNEDRLSVLGVISSDVINFQCRDGEGLVFSYDVFEGMGIDSWS